jgi:uncharacterized protein
VDPALAALLALVGVAAGFLSALFGIGGGIVMVPLLHYGLGVPWHMATAYSLMAIAIMAPWAVYQHGARKAVDWRIGGYLALGGAVGVAAGAWLEPRVPVPGLKLLFAGLMAFAAYRLVARPVGPRVEAHGTPFLVALGVACGVTAKLLGIGGGLISVPALALTGTAIHVAVGSSLVPVFTNGAAATAIGLAAGLDLWNGVPMAAGGLLGIPLGAAAAHAMPAAGLKRVFAAALVLAAVAIAATSGAW